MGNIRKSMEGHDTVELKTHFTIDSALEFFKQWTATVEELKRMNYDYSKIIIVRERRADYE